MNKSAPVEPLNIALLNAHYSANLGDGLLSSCLAFGLCQHDPHMNVFPVDLAARKTYSTLGGEARGPVLKILSGLPRLIRLWAIRLIQFYMVKKIWRPHFEKELSKADSLVLGGGNLITDKDLNFPIKISTALSVANDFDLPVYVYGVGVGSNFSRRGGHLFSSAFKSCNLRSVSVRDLKSKENWNHYFSESSGHTAKVVLDPGLLCARVWDEKSRTLEFSGNFDCAIGIMSPDELSYHHTKGQLPDLKSWYMDLIDVLRSSGLRVCIFSNGSPEDTRFLNREILDKMPSVEHVIPKTPHELAQIASHSDMVIAFRLHALIPAISYGKKVIALEWDHKVRSFMGRIDQQENCFNVRDVTGADVAQKCLALRISDFVFPDTLREVDGEISELAQFILTQKAREFAVDKC